MSFLRNKRFDDDIEERMDEMDLTHAQFLDFAVYLLYSDFLSFLPLLRASFGLLLLLSDCRMSKKSFLCLAAK